MSYCSERSLTGVIGSFGITPGMVWRWRKNTMALSIQHRGWYGK